MCFLVAALAPPTPTPGSGTALQLLGPSSLSHGEGALPERHRGPQGLQGTRDVSCIAPRTLFPGPGLVLGERWQHSSPSLRAGWSVWSVGLGPAGARPVVRGCPRSLGHTRRPAAVLRRSLGRDSQWAVPEMASLALPPAPRLGPSPGNSCAPATLAARVTLASDLCGREGPVRFSLAQGGLAAVEDVTGTPRPGTR